MTRREFSAKVKAQAALRANGRCEGGLPCGERCGIQLRYGGFHYDHVVPDGLGGEPTLDNCQVLCRGCHQFKTHKHDNPLMKKADRMRKRAENRKATRSSLPFGRNSRLKRKLNGEIVERT